MKNAKQIILGLLTVSMLASLAAAMEPEVLYKDDNVVMEKIGQIIIDAYKVCWRAEEVPDTELKKLSDKAVVIDKNASKDSSTVLYPFLIFVTSGDYSKTSAKFIDYKGALLNEVSDLLLLTGANFAHGVVMFKGCLEKNEGMIHTYDYQGKELCKFNKIGVQDIAYAYVAPEEKIVSYDVDADWFTVSDFTGTSKNINIDLGFGKNITISRDGSRIGLFINDKITMWDYNGKELWSTKTGFSARVFQTYISPSTEYVMAYSIRKDFQAQRIILLNPTGKIIDQQIIPKRGHCSFYESMNAKNLGIIFSAHENTTIYKYAIENNINPQTYLMKVDMADQPFALSVPEWPIISTSDGGQIMMIMPNRANGNQKDVIRITLLK